MRSARPRRPAFIGGAVERLGHGAREWWPAAIAGDRLPPGRDTPSAWLSFSADLAFLDLPQNIPVRQALPQGEPVPFVWRECRSALEMTVYPDGSFEPHGLLPRDATHVWDVRDPGLVFSGIDDFAAFYAEGIASPARVRMRLCRWSSRPISFRLERSAGRFSLVDDLAGTNLSARPDDLERTRRQRPQQRLLRSA
jgi:hypothetical protein